MRWFKHFADESILGTLKTQCTAEERGVWWDLMELAAKGRRPGIIAPNRTEPYPFERIAQLCNIDLELLTNCLRKFQEQERLVVKADGIHILNWKKFQSEYQRQKPYREKRKGREAATGETIWDAKGWFETSIHGVQKAAKFLSDFADRRWGASHDPQGTMKNLVWICQNWKASHISEAMKELHHTAKLDDFPGGLKAILKTKFTDPDEKEE